MPAISVQALHKDYGPVHAVDGLSFTVEPGEVFALVGPNGAGKTTTVEILEGHRRRSSGTVDVLGFDPETGGRDFRERIGIVLQDAGLDEDFTVRELVRLYRGMYPRRLAGDDVIELVGLVDKRDARVKTLSGGQRRRLDLALGLVDEMFTAVSRTILAAAPATPDTSARGWRSPSGPRPPPSRPHRRRADAHGRTGLPLRRRTPRPAGAHPR